MRAPARSKPVRVPVSGGHVYAEVEGLGPRLLLISGLGQSSYVWRWVKQPLARVCRTIVYDARGTGRSSAPAAGCSIGSMAADAAAVLRRTTGEAAHVVGLSMGGYVALTLALAEPQLVRSLVLLATGGGGPGRVPRPAHVREAYAAAIGLPHEEYGKRTLPHTLAPGWPQAHPERYHEILAARLELPTTYETIEAHAEACYAYYRCGPAVEEIDVPALVVHGDTDLIVPVENGRRLAQRLPNADYVELPGRGHNLPLEEPETVARLVGDFVGRQPERR